MADRTVYGKTHSENGWRMVDQGSCVWVKVPGTNVTLQIREGQPAAILGAFAADYNTYVEPLRDADSACWTATNSVASSNHLSGTAMDLNWNGADGRTFRFQIPEERAYPPPKNKAVRELLDFYEGMVFCGGFWSIRDWMHFQMGGSTYGSQHVGKVNDFIRRKIRADGFSTYKRGGTPAPPPPPPVEDGALVLSKAMGGSVSLDRYRELLPGVRDAILRCKADQPKRINMWMAQIGHESGGLKYMEEIADGSAYEGRKDLGNTQPGDGKRFKGRGPIQITGRHNYTKLSQWAHSQGLVPSPTFFVDQPAQLATPQYGFLGVVWYWTVARPNINAMCDNDDLNGVTKAINGGLNGLEDRRNRWNRARSMDLAPIMRGGTQPPPPTQGDDMAQVPQEQWDRVYRELTQRLPSRSPLRRLGEGLVDTAAGFILNIDGSQHVEIVKLLAGYGHPPTLALLREVAGADPVKFPDRQDDRLIAQAILADVTAAPVATVVNAPVAVTSGDSAAFAELERLRAENARLQAALDAGPPERIVYLPAPEPEPAAVPAVPTDRTSGDRVGQLIDSVEDWTELALAMDVKQRAALAASIKVLEISSSNGSQL
jgi:predicted chitinase